MVHQGIGVYLLDTSVWLPIAISKHVHNVIATMWLNSVQAYDSILFAVSLNKHSFVC